MVPPTAQATGIREKPRATLVSSVRSAIMLFMTPMFPLSIPFKQRLAHPIRVRYSEESNHTPEDKRPERTGKAKQEARDRGTEQTAQKYGFPAYFIGKTAPLKHSNCLGSKIQGHLWIQSAHCRRPTEERRINETYYKSCVVSDLSFVTTNDWELTDKLKDVTNWMLCLMGMNERTWFM